MSSRSLSFVLLNLFAAAAPSGVAAASQSDRRPAALELLQKGEVKLASAVLRSWCEEAPADVGRARTSADLLLQGRLFSEAEEFARRWADVSQDDPRAAVMLGSCMLLAGDHPRAEEFHRETVRRFSGHAEMWFGLGMSCARNQKLLAAQDAFEKAITIDARKASYRFWAGDNLLRLSRYAEAALHLREALRGPGPVADAEWKLALVYAHQNDLEAAERQFERAVERLQGRSQQRSCFHYGVFLYEHGRFEDAAAQLEFVTRGWPEHRTAWYYQARVLRRLERSEAAAAAHATYQRLQTEEDRLEDEHLLAQLRLERR